jgi:putative nucleotidyltransferase with HDIG domain
MDFVEPVAAHARDTYPAGDFPHILEVVAYAHQLAAKTGADEEIVTIAAYFHDISRATMGPQEHNVKSAEMARQWLSQHGYSEERTERVAAAIVAHMRPTVGQERESLPVESRILYDADKISRAQGFGLIGALVHLGQKTSWEELGYAQLAKAIQRGRYVAEKTYRSLYTDAARQLAAPGHRLVIEFCDRLLAMEVFQVAKCD